MSIPTWGGPEPQYQPPQSPHYGGPYQQPPAPKQSNTALVVVSTVAILLALALVGFLAYYLVSGGGPGNKSDGAAALTSRSVDSPPPAAKSTITTTVDEPAPVQKPVSASCDYSTWDVTDPEVTTPGFASNVYSDFKAACRNEGTPNVTLVDVYSPTTEKYYTMTCRDRGDQVVCTGGRNAAVYIS